MLLLFLIANDIAVSPELDIAVMLAPAFANMLFRVTPWGGNGYMLAPV